MNRQGDGMRLKVSEASIHTVQVQVKSLTISGKQVTLAVFRQLVEEPLISYEGHFNGIPWGTVNYHPNPQCKKAFTYHMHVVWQLGDELRRAQVEESPVERGYWIDSAEDWLNAALLDGWHPARDTLSDEVRVQWPNGVVRIALTTTQRNFLSYSPSVKEELQEDVDAVGKSREELASDVEAELDVSIARHKQRLLRWEELKELPQLFIAV